MSVGEGRGFSGFSGIRISGYGIFHLKMTENSGLISQCAALIHRSRLVVLVRLQSASRSSGLAALRHYYAENVPSHWHPAVVVEVREDKWPTNEHG